MAQVTMYHGDNEIEVQEHSVETMKARGWSTKKQKVKKPDGKQPADAAASTGKGE